MTTHELTGDPRVSVPWGRASLGASLGITGGIMQRFCVTGSNGLLFLCCVLFSATSAATNLHLIESRANGFAIYRSGKPNAADMKEICRLGIQEMYVLSGDAGQVERSMRQHCLTLKIVFDENQDIGTPLAETFINRFDQWVAEGQALGKKLLFRCHCGCHRTGRLAAYYQIKYQGLDVEQAMSIMNSLGKWMQFYPQLQPQVRALSDFVYHLPCSQEAKFCVIRNPV